MKLEEGREEDGVAVVFDPVAYGLAERFDFLRWVVFGRWRSKTTDVI